MDEWTHRYTSTRAYPSYGKGYSIKVEAGLHKIGSQQPYFSVTAEIYRSGAADCDACGCLHDEVLKFWPKLKPVIDLHLCDDTGTPMHAVENGWYDLAGYYGGAGERYHRGNSTPTKTPEECLQMFADHVRIPLEDARALAEGWRADDDPAAMRRWYGQWMNTQIYRWQAEADAAIKLLDELIAAQAAKVVER